MAASFIMDRHPEVEQVGFVRIAGLSDGHAQVVLDMAGGEFCGNASMCAALWYVLQTGGAGTAVSADITGTKDELPNSVDNTSVFIKVSGADKPVEVRITQDDGGVFRADVHMPPGYSIVSQEVSFEGRTGVVPIVHMTGISHMIIKPDSEFSFLLKDKEAAGLAVRKWCRELEAPGLGLMFLENKSEETIRQNTNTDGSGEQIRNRCLEYRRTMTPLVYIPGSDTLFWEHSCASGSSAVCRYMASGKGREVRAELMQPGGVLSVKNSADNTETWLTGTVIFSGRFQA